MDKKYKKKEKKKNYLSRLMILIILVLGILILLKSNNELKDNLYNKVFKENISFAKINSWYEKKFGKITKEETKEVSKEKIEYSKIEKHKKGVKLTLKDNYSIPLISSGLIIYAGEKEDYGKTVILQRPDGIEVWYTNLKSINVDLYDYIKEGEIVGTATDNTLYMYFQKESEFIDYKGYI